MPGNGEMPDSGMPDFGEMPSGDQRPGMPGGDAVSGSQRPEMPGNRQA